MDKVNIKVVGIELFEGGVKVGFNFFWLVRVVLEFRDKEEIFLGDIWGFDILGNLEKKLVIVFFLFVWNDICFVLVFCICG